MLGSVAPKAHLRRDSSEWTPCDFSRGFFSSRTCGVDDLRSSWSTVDMNESRLSHSSLHIGSTVGSTPQKFPISAAWALTAAAAVALSASSAHAALLVPEGLYKVQCGESVSDGGQLGATGVLDVKAGHATGTLRLELSVSSDEVDAPEAEQHTLPAMKVEGDAAWGESAFTPIDGRPQRLVIELTPTNWSLKGRLGAFFLVDNNAPEGGDDETSTLNFDRQDYNGVCKIEKK